ncbi:hypothetical protein IVA95_34255 [Bradyrhizobium sp. 157]|uniref:hypothetical protein n=1 Tax=Bradyrhizobium sp. 157 TaxID=2782631 RepID=UPI001FFA96D8|nr:hypothetical protein [Bradyrhizobium sp. 157]MCK1642486.1 hypothetical protein [Bradyrhizobium sp. 157]
MKVQDVEQLDYLHDALLKKITFASTDKNKNLLMNVICDDDCGYPDWCGKKLVVTFSNVVRASGTLLGHITGYDTVQSLDEGASEDMKEGLRQLSEMGIVPPQIIRRLILHSGSELEIACDSIDVGPDE